MKKGLVILLFSLSLAVSAQNTDSRSLFSLHAIPGVSLPLGESSTLFSLGGTLSLSAEYCLPSLSWFYLDGGLDYDLIPFLGVQKSISVLSGNFGAGVKLNFTPWLVFKGEGCVGYFFGTLNDFSIASNNPRLSVDAGMYITLGQFEIGARASYRYLFGLYDGLSASLAGC